jgi:hypothetical protein
MKSWFILLTWICVASPVLAFRGQVVSEDGEPIAGAVVSIVVQAGSSRTDPQGEFVWEPDPPQPFEILVALPKGQYASPVLIEKLEDGRDLIVRIRPVFELAVNVVALDDASPLDDVPARSLSLMLRQDLAAPGHVFVRGMVFGVDDEPGPTERHVAGYGIVDLGGGWRFGEDLEVTVLARNLAECPVSRESGSGGRLGSGPECRGFAYVGRPILACMRYHRGLTGAQPCAPSARRTEAPPTFLLFFDW